LGITMASLALGAVGENTFEQLFAPYFHNLALPAGWQGISALLEGVPLLLSLIVVTSIHVVLGEQVPKVATLHAPEQFALFVAQPMSMFSAVFKWFVDLLDWATRLILSALGIKMVGEHQILYTVEELKEIMTESEEVGLIEEPEREMLHAIFDLGELLVRQVMVPRTEIIAVEADLPLDEVVKITTASFYTKFPVYDDSLDQIIGVLHVKELLQKMSQPEYHTCIARDLAREALFVPEAIAVSELLQQFRTRRTHIAIVLDEYGGTAGLITLEDLLEEIVGEVSDPFDDASLEIQTLPDGSALIDGMTLIEEVNEELGLNLDDPHYDTIAGFVLGKLGRMARLGDVIETDTLRLRVEEMDGLRIARVSLTFIQQETGPDNA
jgi:putative hemolysin